MPQIFHNLQAPLRRLGDGGLDGAPSALLVHATGPCARLRRARAALRLGRLTPDRGQRAARRTRPGLPAPLSPPPALDPVLGGLQGLDIDQRPAAQLDHRAPPVTLVVLL